MFNTRKDFQNVNLNRLKTPQRNKKRVHVQGGPNASDRVKSIEDPIFLNLFLKMTKTFIL